MKITVVGAGSSYTPELIEGIIIRHERINITELALVDCFEGQRKLDIIADLSARMFNKKGIEVKITKHLNWKDALPGSSFVLTQMRIGLLKARAIDEDIPGKFGLLGQETNGIGGLFKALRTVPVIFDLVDDVKILCPDAWIINFTNPAGMVTEAVHRYKKYEKFIGLCNVPIHFEIIVNQIINPKEELKIDFVGLNHFVYATGFYENNRDCTSKYLKYFTSPEIKHALSINNIPDMDWEDYFIENLGAIPCFYHRYYYKKKETLTHFLDEYQQGINRARQVMKIEEKLFEKYQDINLCEKPKELEERGGAHYSTAACSLIESIITNDGKDHVINYPNRSAVKNLDTSIVLEYTARIKDGVVVSALNKDKINEDIRSEIMKIKQYELDVCKGIYLDDEGLILKALTLHPLSISDAVAKAAFDELYDAHRAYLRLTKKH